MARHAIINNETNKVVNVILWDGNEWLPPKNHLVVQSDLANIGDDYNRNSNTFSNKQSE